MIPDWLLYVKLAAEATFLAFLGFFLWRTRKSRS